MPDRIATMRAAGDYLAAKPVDKPVRPIPHAIMAGLALSVIGVLFFIWSTSSDELEASIIMATGGFFLVVGAVLLSYGIAGRLYFGVTLVSNHPEESFDPVDIVIMGFREHPILTIMIVAAIIVLGVAIIL